MSYSTKMGGLSANVVCCDYEQLQQQWSLRGILQLLHDFRISVTWVQTYNWLDDETPTRKFHKTIAFTCINVDDDNSYDRNDGDDDDENSGEVLEEKLCEFFGALPEGAESYVRAKTFAEVNLQINDYKKFEELCIRESDAAIDADQYESISDVLQ